MIDYHCHLLPYIDDGPTSMEESVFMASMLQKAGYHTVYCTPHLIHNLYEATNEEVRTLVQDVQQILIRKGIGLKICTGREYYLDEHFSAHLSDLLPLENTKIVLIEFQSHTYPGLVKDTILSITRKGFTPLIAHPERCQLFHDNPVSNTILTKSSLFEKLTIKRNPLKSDNHQNNKTPDLINWLAENRCLFQNNLLSFLGVYGNTTQNTANKLLKNNIYTHFGTDAHSEYCIEKIFFPSN